MTTDKFRISSFEEAADFFKDNVDAVIVTDSENNTIKPLVKRGIFRDFIDDNWQYTDLIQQLWYHFSNSSEKIVEDYQVFLPKSGDFVGKYSKRTNLMIDDIIHVVQMTVYPMGDNLYLYMLDELDKSMYREQDMTNKKVDTIQNMYLFSMYIDIVKDTTNSISVTEISDEVLNQQIKYSEWRMMIVNMISKEFQPQFLEETDPETLKRKYAPGQTSSFDCLMMNLEGVYIWVKLIFSRAETSNDDDFRFVFMVQNIHETAVELHQTLKEYELRASLDTLTSVYNHGRIETEIVNAIAEKEKTENSISMMILDIDFFKQINDTYGHSAGDVALVDFTKTINGCIGDMNAVFGRWGGEEFVMVCYDAPLEKTLEIAENLRAQVESAEFEKIGRMTCSIGVTEITDDDKFDTAFDRMDKALYRAKSEGRNCVRYEA